VPSGWTVMPRGPTIANSMVRPAVQEGGQALANVRQVSRSECARRQWKAVRLRDGLVHSQPAPLILQLPEFSRSWSAGAVPLAALCGTPPNIGRQHSANAVRPRRNDIPGVERSRGARSF
jgi:hypothetical protein